MRSSRAIPLLLLLLIAQVALTVWLWRGSAAAPPLPTMPLLQLDRSAVTRIEINGAGQTLDILRQADQWVLPAKGGFPAGAAQVDHLLQSLKNLQPGFAVATSADAATRFRVAEDRYERRIRLFSDDRELVTLYLGDAAGPRRVFGRVKGRQAIYPLTFDAYQAEPRVEAWTDKTWLHRDPADIKSVKLGDIVLARDGDGWQLAGLADGERTDQDKAWALVSRLTDLNFMAVVGKVDKVPEGASLFDAQLTLTGDIIVTYRFTDPGQGGDPLLRLSDRDFVLRIASFTVKPLQETTRAQLVVAAPVPPLVPDPKTHQTPFTPTAPPPVGAAPEVHPRSSVPAGRGQ